MKPAASYQGREQTYLKHFFLERYLETVAFHIGYTHRSFVYADCFSGPWKATDETLADTSIRIALDKLKYVRDGLAAHRRDPNIRAIFIEKDAAAFRALRRALDQHGGAIKTTALPGAFEDNIEALLREVGTAFSFCFIDPKGWTGFAMDHIAPILKHQPGEVMVNFMYDFINRFINCPDPANERSLDQFFGTTTWRDIRNASDRETASLECYKEQLRMLGGFSYVTSTRILKPHSDRAYFHLVYATRSPKGITEFRRIEKETVKEQDEVRATAQREQRVTKSGQGELIFAPSAEISPTIVEERNRHLQQANERIATLLQRGPAPYEVLQPRVLELPLVWKTDLDNLLLAGQRHGAIVIDGMGARDRTPKKGCTIRLAPRPKL